MSNNRLKKLDSKSRLKKPAELEKYVVIGLSKEGMFIWSARNVANLFEVLGYIDLARDEIKARLRTVPIK